LIHDIAARSRIVAGQAKLRLPTPFFLFTYSIPVHAKLDY
jgi:hypothetical protein